MTTSTPRAPDNDYRLGFHWRVIGSSAPVFPGLEKDICDPSTDEERRDALWHRGRARAMLAAHPEIKKLFGRTPSTAFWCVLMPSLQIAVALMVSGSPLWVVVGAAYVIGCITNINLFMLAHECDHGLVFRSKPWNRRLFTLASLPMMLSGHHTWWIEHLSHHRDQGAKKDFVKRRRLFFLESRRRFLYFFTRGRYLHWFTWLSAPLFFPYSAMVIPLQFLRSLVGLVSYLVDLATQRGTPSKRTLDILTDTHLTSGYRKEGIEMWAVQYSLLSLLMLGGVFLLGGWQAVLYLFLSAVFMSGFLHPIAFGMILNDSHFHGRREYQPSTSYYGPWNLLTFNFGLHTEHHDFPGIPWSRLPRLRHAAPEYYDPLDKTSSYARLSALFVFERRADRDSRFDNELSRTDEASRVRGATG